MARRKRCKHSAQGIFLCYNVATFHIFVSWMQDDSEGVTRVHHNRTIEVCGVHLAGYVRSMWAKFLTGPQVRGPRNVSVRPLDI